MIRFLIFFIFTCGHISAEEYLAEKKLDQTEALFQMIMEAAAQKEAKRVETEKAFSTVLSEVIVEQQKEIFAQMREIVAEPNQFLAAEGREGNGGNDTAEDFTKLAWKGFYSLQAQQLTLLESPNMSKRQVEELETAIKGTKVYSVGYKLCANEQDKECPGEEGFVAKNYLRRNYILVNFSRWKSKLLSDTQRARIALHEYLGIIGLEQGNYAISSKIIIEEKVDEDYQHYVCQFSLYKGLYGGRDGRHVYLNHIGSSSKSINGRGFNTSGFDAFFPFQVDDKNNVIILSGVISDTFVKIKVLKGVMSAKSLFPSEWNEEIIPIHTIMHGEQRSVKYIRSGDFILFSSCIGY